MSGAVESKTLLLERRLQTVFEGTAFEVRIVRDGLEVHRAFSPRRTRTPFRYHLRLDEENSRVRISPAYWLNETDVSPSDGDQEPRDRTGDLIKAELTALDWQLEDGPGVSAGSLTTPSRVLPLMLGAVLLAFAIRAIADGAWFVIVAFVVVGIPMYAIWRAVENREME